MKCLKAFIALFLAANLAFLSACDNKSDSRKKRPNGSTRNRVTTADATCKLELGDDKDANCALINQKKNAPRQSAVCEIVWAKAFQSEQCEDQQVASNDMGQDAQLADSTQSAQPAPAQPVQVATSSQPSPAVFPAGTVSDAPEIPRVLAIKTDTAPDTDVTIETNRPSVTLATARQEDLAVVQRATFNDGTVTTVAPLQTMAIQPAEVFIPIMAAQVTPASLVSNPKACEMIGKVNVRARAHRADLDISLDTYKTSLSNWARMVCSQDPTEAQPLWREIKFQLGGNFEGHTGVENCWRELTGLATACSNAVRGGNTATVFN